MELRDGELLLRPPTDADVPAVVDACQDEELSRFIPGFPKPYRERDARGWIASRNPRDEASKAFLIANATSGELLGAIEVRLGEVGSIGYWIAKGAGDGASQPARRGCSPSGPSPRAASSGSS